MILSVDKLDRLIARIPSYLCAGIILVGVQWQFGVGILSAIHLFTFGVLLACLSDYRTEPGLWMLALLYGLLYLTFAVVWEYHTVVDCLRGAPVTWDVWIDAGVAIRIQWLIVQVAASVVVYNRRVASA
jgi:hypothetical protein